MNFDGAIWCFDEGAAAEWGRLIGEAYSKKHPLPVIDSLICAITRSMGAKIVSSDKKGFIGCTRVDPWSGLEYPAWQSA